MLGLWKLGDVVAGVLQGHNLAPAGQRDRFVEWTENDSVRDRPTFR
jgi:hypothetical protein